MFTFYKITLAVILVFAASTALLAQPSGPPATPIDGGLSLLLAGGAAYGIKKLRDHKRGK